MKRLGTAVRTAQGVLVVQSPDETTPELGTEVVDESLGTVGTVVDVFGPVERPYLAISPDADDRLAMLVGSPVYTRP